MGRAGDRLGGGDGCYGCRGDLLEDARDARRRRCGRARLGLGLRLGGLGGLGRLRRLVRLPGIARGGRLSFGPRFLARLSGHRFGLLGLRLGSVLYLGCIDLGGILGLLGSNFWIGLLLGLYLPRLGPRGLERALLALPGLATLARAALTRGFGRGQHLVPVLAARDGHVEAAALERRELAEVGERGEERLCVGVAEVFGCDALCGQRLERARQKRLPADAERLAQQLVQIQPVGVRERHGPVVDVPLCHEMLQTSPDEPGVDVLAHQG